MANLTSFPLEGDGVVHNLFYYLWSKDELECGPDFVAIPDTVVYRYRQPAFWFFTSVKDGSIKRKNRGNLSNAKIEEAFLSRKLSGSDIIAYYIWNDDSGKTIIEYFDSETFVEFLYHRQKANYGILQRFVEPRGVHNSQIRAVWSPKLCLLERRQNLKKLHDSRHSIYERAVTYEGEEFNSRTDPVRGTILPDKLHQVCESIVSHVAEVTFQKFKISRMVLNFKVDPAGKLWLLWCSSLRISSTSMLDRERDPSKLRLSDSSALLDRVVSVPPEVRLTSLVPIPDVIADPEKKNPGHFSKYPAPVPLGTKGRGGASSSQARPLGGGALGSTQHPYSGFSFLSAEPSTISLISNDTCPSCGSSMSLTAPSGAAVAYKTVITHYNQVLRFLNLVPHSPSVTPESHTVTSPTTHQLAGAGYDLSSDEEEEIPVESRWPKETLALSTAGGVGLYGVYATKSAFTSGAGSGAGASRDRASSPSRRDRGPKVEAVSEIPPSIALLHPGITPAEYRKYKHDPQFFLKTMKTCEGCFLVYAKIAHAVMEGNSVEHAVSLVFGRKASKRRLKKAHPVTAIEGARRAKDIRERAREQASLAMFGAAPRRLQGPDFRREENYIGDSTDFLYRPAPTLPEAGAAHSKSAVGLSAHHIAAMSAEELEARLSLTTGLSLPHTRSAPRLDGTAALGSSTKPLPVDERPEFDIRLGPGVSSLSRIPTSESKEDAKRSAYLSTVTVPPDPHAARRKKLAASATATMFESAGAAAHRDFLAKTLEAVKADIESDAILRDRLTEEPMSQEEAALKIQTAARARAAKQETQRRRQLKEEQSAARIQALYRGKSAREKILPERQEAVAKERAAVRIQSVQRRRAAQKRVKNLKDIRDKQAHSSNRRLSSPEPHYRRIGERIDPTTEAVALSKGIIACGARNIRGATFFLAMRYSLTEPAAPRPPSRPPSGPEPSPTARALSPTNPRPPSTDPSDTDNRVPVFNVKVHDYNSRKTKAKKLNSEEVATAANPFNDDGVVKYVSGAVKGAKAEEFKSMKIIASYLRLLPGTQQYAAQLLEYKETLGVLQDPVFVLHTYNVATGTLTSKVMGLEDLCTFASNPFLERIDGASSLERPTSAPAARQALSPSGSSEFGSPFSPSSAVASPTTSGASLRMAGALVIGGVLKESTADAAAVDTAVSDIAASDGGKATSDLQLARVALTRVTTADLERLAELKKDRNPPFVVVKLLGAVCVILRETASWKRAVKLVAERSFINRLIVLEPSDITTQTWRVTCKLMEGSLVSQALTSEYSAALGPIAQWLKAITRDFAVRMAAVSFSSPTSRSRSGSPKARGTPESKTGESEESNAKAQTAGAGAGAPAKLRIGSGGSRPGSRTSSPLARQTPKSKPSTPKSTASTPKAAVREEAKLEEGEEEEESEPEPEPLTPRTVMTMALTAVRSLAVEERKALCSSLSVPPSDEAVAHAMCLCLGKDPTWTSALGTFLLPASNFEQRLSQVDAKLLTSETVDRIEKLTGEADAESELMKSNRTLSVILSWVRAVIGLYRDTRVLEDRMGS